MKTVQVQAPGSCGEFIQGKYKGQPCLVSCPINLFTTVTIQEKEPKRYIPYKAGEMVDTFFKTYRLSIEDKHNIRINIDSTIPMGKGMASSTADLVALSYALGEYFGIPLSRDDIASLCIKVEPTDNVMYTDLNLFNHISGERLMTFGKSLEGSILIFEFRECINTVDFNNSKTKETNEGIFMNIIREFSDGLEENNWHKIGRACTASAKLNQERLYKPNLEALIEAAHRFGAFGVNTGHSGSVIGVIFDEEVFETQAFLEDIAKKIPKTEYNCLLEKKIIPGGYWRVV
jgi:L-threonine kinase